MCVVHPVIEEAFKRIHPALGSAVIAANEAVVYNPEAYESFCKNPLLDPGKVIFKSFVSRFMGHYALAKMPYSTGVFAHGLYNAACIAFNPTQSAVLASPISAIQNLWNFDTLCSITPQLVHGVARLLTKSDEVTMPEFKDGERLELGDVVTDKPEYMTTIGLTFTDYIPEVQTSNWKNEANAVIRRMMGNKLSEDLSSFSSYAKLLRQLWYDDIFTPQALFTRHQLCPIFSCESWTGFCPRCLIFESHDAAFAAWNSAERFGIRVSEEHRDEYDRFQHEGFQRKHHLRVMHVKKEKKPGDITTTSSVLGDPRGIQDVSRRVHSILGPYFYSFSKFLSRRWDGKNYWLMYAAGHTGEEFYANLPKSVWKYCGDISRFDRSVSERTLRQLAALHF
jgi:hypothetical protein